MIVRKLASVLAAALVAACPLLVRADGVVTAFLAKTESVAAGAPATFQIGITSTDGTTWPAATVTVGVTITAQDGTTVAQSQAIAAPGDVVPGETTPVFVDVALPQNLSGAYVARATVLHAGAAVGTTDPIAIAVGTIAAAPPAVQPALSGQLASNDVFAGRSAQSGTLAFTGTYGGGRSYQTNLGLSSTPGAQKPIVTIQTSGALTQVGTFSPSLDPLVLSGATGSGLGFKRVWGPNTLSLATVSGANATTNPFTIDGVSYARAVGAWTIATTFGDERVDGDVPAGIPFFMRSGTLAAVAFTRPADAHGLSYGFHYAVVDYQDEVANRRRTDSAIDATIGFAIKRSAWTFDVVRTGPYFPNLSAPGVTPDRQAESLQGTIPVGVVSLTAGVNGYRDALDGSPSVQKTHFWTETLGASMAMRSGDTLSLNLANASQHRWAEQSFASGNDNTALSYTMKRGATTYAFTLGSANQRDSLDNLQHTVQDGVTVTRAFGPYFTFSTGLNLTGNHANAASATSLLQALVSSARWTRGDWSVTSSLNRATTIPYLGTTPTPTTALNYGVVYKPHNARTALNATITQNYGAASSSTSSLNLTRQF